jgi:cohesin domain-containing protein
MRANTRKLILLAVFSGLAGYAALESRQGGLTGGTASQPGKKSEERKEAASGAESPASAGRAGRFVMQERAPLNEPRAEIFGANSWDPPPSKVAAASQRRPAPTAPPMPYRFAGQLIQGDRPEVLLANGDSVIPVVKGDTLDGLYRVEAIGETEITLVYLPLKQRQTIPVFGVLPIADASSGQARSAPSQVAPLAPAPASADARTVDPAFNVPNAVTPAGTEPAASNKPARLLWEGPRHVKIGTQFSVALKVTSEQPVRASPMQLKFDPSVLETVAVKAGRFFGQDQRNFSYRVNPDGSIFVGASNLGPESASDAEFLVVTFKPLKPTSVAELSIASVNLMGSAGRMITLDPLIAFKTAITP